MIAIYIAVGLVVGPVWLWSAFWLTCRLGAVRCPECGSKWQTELMGEWDGEDWKCHACEHAWVEPY